MTPDPIRMACEGSDCPGHGSGVEFGDVEGGVQTFTTLTMCAMCGRQVPAEGPDERGRFIAKDHDRDDVIAMIERGDYG